MRTFTRRPHLAAALRHAAASELASPRDGPGWARCNCWPYGIALQNYIVRGAGPESPPSLGGLRSVVNRAALDCAECPPAAGSRPSSGSVHSPDPRAKAFTMRTRSAFSEVIEQDRGRRGLFSTAAMVIV